MYTFKIVYPNPTFRSSGELAIRIERVSDGTFWDANDTVKTFKTDSECKNPWITMSLGESHSQGRLEAVINLDSTVFTDGDYRINFHEFGLVDYGFNVKPLVDLRPLYIYAGQVTHAFTDVQIARRIMDSIVSKHTIAGSLGSVIANIQEQLNSAILKASK